MPESGAGRRAESQSTALLAAQAALQKQAEDVVVMDLRALSTVADFFVICTGTSGRQIEALKDHIEAVLSQQGCRVWHVEGTSGPVGPSKAAPEFQWILMDCGEIVVHFFDERSRSFYRLEQLWADAPRLPVEASIAPHGTEELKARTPAPPVEPHGQSPWYL